jgi:type IV secretory pathway TraG/TraD family ATPase VirD4
MLRINILMIKFLNVWIHYAEKLWLVVGFAFGVCLVLMWLFRKNSISGFFGGVAFLLFIFQPGFYFTLPYLSIQLAGQEVRLDDYHLWAFCSGALIGIAAVVLLIRYSSPKFEQISNRLTKTSSVERNRKTDIRQIDVHLPNPQKKYVPRDYFNIKKGVFFGLDEQKRPVYIPLEKWRKSHLDVVGTTGSGKGVAAAVLLTQALHTGESIVILDPKNDEFLPHVMRDAAQDARVPYIYIDLMADVPQWNPLQNKTSHEIEELFTAGFSLGEKGTDADFYRLDDRRAARITANLAQSECATLSKAHRQLLETQPVIAEAGKKFVSDLEEISLIQATNIETGVDLAGLIQKGAVIYVRGSMRNPRILKLQRIFVLSIMQHIESRAREKARHVCIFMDEFKYLISRPSLEALGAIRDKGAHVIIAHQSLGDLRDCPADLDPESVVSSVNENCAIKISYAVKDPDTADWLARMSGSILVDDEIRQVKTNAGLTEVRENGRSLRQAERNLVDTNMLQALPDRCAVLFGAGLAKFFFTSPIPVVKSPLATKPVQFISNKLGAEVDASRPVARNAQTVAQSMLDVD